jgi:hypothetical protein
MKPERLLELAGVKPVEQEEQLDEVFRPISQGLRKLAGLADRIIPRNKPDSRYGRSGLDGAEALQTANRQPLNLPSRNPATQGPGTGVFTPKDAANRADISNYVRSWAASINNSPPQQKIALAKEIVNYLHDRQGDPHLQNIIPGIEHIIKRAGLRNFAPVAIQKIRNGEMFEAWLFNIVNTLLAESNLNWSDIGLTYIVEGEQVQVTRL